jgi:hypothetical protein
MENWPCELEKVKLSFSWPGKVVAINAIANFVIHKLSRDWEPHHTNVTYLLAFIF